MKHFEVGQKVSYCGHVGTVCAVFNNGETANIGYELIPFMPVTACGVRPSEVTFI